MERNFAANPEIILRLFVYGTLKRGYQNHKQFCSRIISVEEAAVWGRLYHLSVGFPAIEVPELLILEHGTDDPLADVIKQQDTIELQFERPEGDWDLIRGELLSFDRPMEDLPPIDRLEGFRPLKRSIYRRVLVPVKKALSITSAWLYCMERPPRQGKRITGGLWIRP
jgi:gamma-glutamylcyclotransferase (GGCT)/AIG2-like uncharacterized protein YtfP